MKKNIIKSLFLLSVALLASCNNDFAVDTPQIAATEPVNIVAVQKPVDNCSFSTDKLQYDLSLVATSDVTVYYRIALKSAAAPTSDALLASGTKISLVANTEFAIATKNLASNTAYVLYAISVNKDGVRSEEVYTKEYSTQTYNDTNILAQIATEFSTATTNQSFKANPVFSNDNRPYGTNVPVVVTKVAEDTYSFNTIWGDFYKTLTNGNTTRPYPATIKIKPDFTVEVTFNPLTVPYGRTASSTAPNAIKTGGTYDPCTKTLELTINWGSPTNPAGFNPPVYVTTTLE
jgi:hypothetical protein